MATETLPPLPIGTTNVALRELFPDPTAAIPVQEFVTEHVEIEEPDGTVIPFALWDCQRDTLRALHEHMAIIVLKARRLGLSWVVLAYALWVAIFHQGIRILILCKTEDDAAELLDRIRRMRDRLAKRPGSTHLLAGLPLGGGRDAVTTLDIGRSTIRALVGTEHAARSETAGFVILDEFAFQRGAGGIWRAVLPTIEGGGRLAVVSTGNGPEGGVGLGAEYAKQWRRAVDGSSEVISLFFPWQARPGRDEAWAARTLARLGDEERFRTEYPAEADDAFITPDADYVYDASGVAAATRLGAELDRLREIGKLPPPVDGTIELGIDWGIGTTHGLIVWELPGGGIYIPPGEIAVQRGEPSALTKLMLDKAAAYDHELDEARYDSAGAQQMATFAAVAPESVGLFGVLFNKRKTRTIGYLRGLFRRAAAGETERVIAISPENRELLRQLRGLKQNERGEVIKGDDHGPDALVAGAWPVAALFPDVTDLETHDGSD